MLTGGSFTKFDDFFKTLNLMSISKAEFYKIQDAYIFPVINEAWKGHKKELITKLKGKHIALTGDGSCDSPGYSAKYCTYTFIEQSSGQIIDFELVQVSEVANSCVMEKEAFFRALSRLQRDLDIVQIATDRHVQIRSLLTKQ